MKGIYTQGVTILTDRLVAIDELRPLLPEYPILRTVDAGSEWAFGGATAVVAYRKEVNGLVAIDSVDRRWPDGMGDTKTEPMIFGAWAMGQFGPFTYPHGLMRSYQQAWTWSDAKAVVERHNSFIRLRLSYAFGADREAKCMPADCNPQHELNFLTGLVQCLLRHPSVVCYFNPSGEVVAPAKAFDSSVEFHSKHSLPPLDLWSNRSDGSELVEGRPTRSEGNGGDQRRQDSLFA